MVRRIEDGMGPDALRAATGRDHAQWRDLLDAVGARVWSHADTARWLEREHGINGWWAQGITVDYEQARKGRVPGQNSDGTFSATMTRTIPGERLSALAAVARAVSDKLGERYSENLAASMPVVRWRPDDGTRVSAAAGPPNRSGTPITVTIERLPSAAAIDASKQSVADLLDRVRREAT